MRINGSKKTIYDAFIQPGLLTRFWLSRASGPLQVGVAVDWEFLVKGASTQTTAIKLQADETIEWRWSDGSLVTISLKPSNDGTEVRVINEGFKGTAGQQIAAALKATEGFAIVLCDLKTLIESGASAGLVRAKAELIEGAKKEQSSVD